MGTPIEKALPISPKSPEAMRMAMDDKAAYLEGVVRLLECATPSGFNRLAIEFLETAIAAESRKADERNIRLERILGAVGL